MSNTNSIVISNNTSVNSTSGNTAAVTMSSLEIVDYINSQRKAGEATLSHYNFMAKVTKVLGDIPALNFKGSYLALDNTTRPCYNFPKREACLMAMSYGYVLLL